MAELIPLWPTWLLQSNHLQMNSLRSPSVTCVENPLLQQLNSCHVVVVSIIFYFHPYLGKWSNLTNMFQMGWNHQPDFMWCLLSFVSFGHFFKTIHETWQVRGLLQHVADQPQILCFGATWPKKAPWFVWCLVWWGTGDIWKLLN